MNYDLLILILSACTLILMLYKVIKSISRKSYMPLGLEGQLLYITNGEGKGQFRKITKVAEDTFTVVYPWDAPPDSTSEFILRW